MRRAIRCINRQTIPGAMLGAFIGASVLVLNPAWAPADIITLNNGRQMKGIVEEQASDPTSVTYTGAAGKQKIPRERIKQIDKEPLATSYIEIGDEFARLNKPEEALSAYDQALKADPQSTAAKEGKAAAQKAIDGVKSNKRQDDIQKIEAQKAKVLDFIRQNQFEKAEEALKAASDLVPTPTQKKELGDLVGELYFAWAKERLDKLDRGQAETYLDRALAARPDDDRIIQELLKLWEGRPDKKDQLLRIYETVLSRKDDDALRLKVANLQFESGNFQDAAVGYLKLYNASDKYKGGEIEQRLRESLEKLHAQSAQKKEYDQAIMYFDTLTKIDPKADKSIRNYYEYMKRASAVTATDVPGRLALAKYAEENRLDPVALQNYRRVVELDPENKEAKAAINRFAMVIINEARNAIGGIKPDYYLAQTLANQAQTEFPESIEAKQAAQEILGRANNEIMRDKRDRREQARESLAAGNTCYQQALNFVRDMSNREVQPNALASPKSEAIRHFRCAIANYETALRIDPSVREDQSSLIAFNLQSSREYVQRLTQAPSESGGLDQSGRPIYSGR